MFLSCNLISVSKTIRLNATHFFVEIPNKSELQQILQLQHEIIHLTLIGKIFEKLYKDYTKEPYSFLLNHTTLSSGNLLRFKEEPIIKMSISEKIKVITKSNKTRLNTI